MNLMIRKLIVAAPMLACIAALVLSISVHADAVEQSWSKVSIVVAGMMKSKSGAT